MKFSVKLDESKILKSYTIFRGRIVEENKDEINKPSEIIVFNNDIQTYEELPTSEIDIDVNISTVGC